MSLRFTHQYKNQVIGGTKTLNNEHILRKDYYNKTEINSNITNEISRSIRDIGDSIKLLKKKSTPKKVNIEDVIANKINNSNSFIKTASKKLKILNGKLLSVNNNDSQKSFYYSNNNEIMSVKQFIDFYKSTNLQRSQLLKSRTKIKIQDAIEKIQKEKINVFNTRKRAVSSSIYLSTKKLDSNNLNDLSQMFNNELLRKKIQKSVNLDIDVDYSSTKNDIKSTYGLENFSQNIIKKVRTPNGTNSGLFNHLDSQNRFFSTIQTTAQEYQISHDEHKKTSQRSRRRIQKIMANMNSDDQDLETERLSYQNSPKQINKIDNITTKYTEKEAIHKLNNLNVLPKHITMNEETTNIMKEKMIQNMFKDHRVMDSKMEKSIQHNYDSRVKNDKSLTSSNEANKFYFLNSLTGVKKITKTNGTAIKTFTSKIEDEKHTQEINSQIQTNIKNIENVLKSQKNPIIFNKRFKNSLLSSNSTFTDKYLLSKENEINLERKDSIRNVPLENESDRNLMDINIIQPKNFLDIPQNPNIITSSRLKTSGRDSQKITQSIEESNDLEASCIITPKLSNSETTILLPVQAPKLIKGSLGANYLLGSKRIPLRNAISKKYNMAQKVNDNKSLARDISNSIKEAKNNVNRQVLIKNRGYVDFFI